MTAFRGTTMAPPPGLESSSEAPPVDDASAEPRSPSLSQARQWALNQLGRRPRSEAEIRRHLRHRKVTDSTVDETIDYLKRAGLIDDAEFSRQWVTERAGRKGYGPVRLASELRQRGVDSESIAAALAEIDSECERELALEAGRSRAASLAGNDPVAARRKLAGFLQRRGFRWDAVSAALEELLPEQTID